MTKLIAAYFIIFSLCATGFISSTTRYNKSEKLKINKKHFNSGEQLKMDSIFEEKYFESTIGIPYQRVVALP